MTHSLQLIQLFIQSCIVSTLELKFQTTSVQFCSKLIGARFYLKGYEQYYGPLNRTVDYKSPRDKDGHGTHTASTVVGRQVPGASSLGGFARGTASGGAPLARLAVYKACWPIPGKGKEDGNLCLEEDMLAAIDDAIGDGVHVLSISIGSSKPINYTDDGIAIGALHAVKKGIVVACSAGNQGPGASTLSNTAPWTITVGASSVDRAFVAPVLLGNGLKVEVFAFVLFLSSYANILHLLQNIAIDLSRTNTHLVATQISCIHSRNCT